MFTRNVLRITCARNLTALDKLNQVAIIGFLFGAGLVVYRGFQVRHEGLWAGDIVCPVASGRDVHCCSKRQSTYRWTRNRRLTPSAARGPRFWRTGAWHHQRVTPASAHRTALQAALSAST